METLTLTLQNFNLNSLPDFSVLLLCGIPGVGKSFFSKLLINYLNTTYSNFITPVYLNFDDLFHKHALYSDTSSNKFCLNLTHYKQIRTEFFNLFKEKVKDLLIKIKNDVDFNKKCTQYSGKYFIILDDNFYLKSMRKPFYKYCKTLLTMREDLNLEVGYLEIHFKSSLEYALKLNAKRKECENIPKEVVKKIYDKFQFNSFNSKFVFDVAVEDEDSVNKIDMGKIIMKIVENKDVLKQITIEEKENVKKVSKKENKEAFVDLLESKLRKKVGEILQEGKIKINSKELSNCKKEFMNVIKCLLYKENVCMETEQNDKLDLMIIIDKIKEDNYLGTVELGLESILNEFALYLNNHVD